MNNINNTNKTFTYELTILERHLDTLGHVNNAIYLEIFEEARWDFITKGGYGIDVIKTANISPIIIESHVKYRKEIRLREKIFVESFVSKKLSKLTFEITQSIYVKSENANRPGLAARPAAKATFIMAVMDLKARKIIVPPDEFLIAMGFNQI